VQNGRISSLEGELEVTRAEVCRLQSDCGEKRDEIDNVRREMDRLTHVHQVSIVSFTHS